MRKFRYLIIALIILADQAAKLAVRCNMQVGESIPVIKNFFSITHISNSGGALSIFEGNTLLLIAVPVLAMAAAVWYMEKHQTAHWSLILAIDCRRRQRKPDRPGVAGICNGFSGFYIFAPVELGIQHCGHSRMRRMFSFRSVYLQI